MEVKDEGPSGIDGLSLPPGLDQNDPLIMLLNMSMTTNRAPGLKFTKVQNEFYDFLVERRIFAADKTFVSKFLADSRNECFELILRKSYSLLADMRSLESIQKATSVLSNLTDLLDHKGFAETFIGSKYYVPDSMRLTGEMLQNDTIYGRILSITAWPNENNTFKEKALPGITRNTVNVHRAAENVSEDFYILYDMFVKFIKAFKKVIGGKSLLWFRQLVDLNLDYFTTRPDNVFSLSTKG